MRHRQPVYRSLVTGLPPLRRLALLLACEAGAAAAFFSYGRHLAFVSSDKYLAAAAFGWAWATFLSPAVYLLTAAAAVNYAFAIAVALTVFPLTFFATVANELRHTARVGSLLFSEHVAPAGGFGALRDGARLLALNPATDLDLSANTDCEDLLVFLADVLEFAEQDRALLLDAVSDAWFLLNWDSAVFTLELFFLARLRRQVLSASLAKVFSA